jgi:NADH-quinone oxidoreductase subunit E
MGNSITSKFDRACAILDKYQRNPDKLIPILQEMQEEYKYLPEEIMTFISVALQISPSTVYGVATFYAHFTLKPKGKNVIKVCDGTACHVKKSEAILKAIEKELGLNKENRTTKDMLFTLETVACLGACGLAPVVVLNDKVHGLMTPESTIALLNEVKRKELEQNA